MTEHRQFEFYLIRYIPEPLRGEFINIGIILNEFESPAGNAVIRVTRNWSRLLCFDPEADVETLELLEADINSKFAQGRETIDALLYILKDHLSNALQISERNVALGADLNAEADRLMTIYVESREQSTPESDCNNEESLEQSTPESDRKNE